MKTILFDAPLRATCHDEALDVNDIADQEIVLETQYSLVSVGTELACYRGTESWAPLPFQPGYAAVGKIVQLGNGIDQFSLGDSVFADVGHAQYHRFTPRPTTLRVPEGLGTKLAPFVRLAATAITALRITQVELGDWVAVQGLGVVGNLAAQLFALQGANVIGLDVLNNRLKLAQTCGITHTINPEEDDVQQVIRDFTGGTKPPIVVEATGCPDLVPNAMELAAKEGEVVLLGSPRGESKADLTTFLNRVHLWDHGCVTLKGAHEWRYPIAPDGRKHSTQRNVKILLNLIAQGKLLIEPLITHIAKPEDAQSVYQGLLSDPNDFVGVLFDWGA